MQVARVVLVHVIFIDGVLGVIVDVLSGHDKVLFVYVAIFVVIFCIWRCTLYILHTDAVDLMERFAAAVGTFTKEVMRTRKKAKYTLHGRLN